jgi:hypothetical protein
MMEAGTPALRVVATLTTRAPPYHAGLLSNLKNLTTAFDEVLLGLPKRSRAGIPYTPPEDLPLGVRIVWLEEDLGPATKILAGAREAQRADLVVTVDDDMLYNSSELRGNFEKFFREDARKGLRRAYAFAGAYIARFCPGIPACISVDGGWHDWRFSLDLREVKPLTTVAGYAGVAYPASLLAEHDPEAFIRRCHALDTDAQLWRNDDVVLSAYLAAHAIERCMLPRTRIGRHNKPASEPLLSPSIWEVVRAARHPAVGPIFAMNNAHRRAPILGDVLVVGVFLLVFFALATFLLLGVPSA